MKTKKQNKKTELLKDVNLEYTDFSDFAENYDERTALNKDYDGNDNGAQAARYQKQAAPERTPDIYDIINGKNKYCGFAVKIVSADFFYDTYQKNCPLAYALLTLELKHDGQCVEHKTRASTLLLKRYARDAKVYKYDDLVGMTATAFFYKNMLYLNSYLCFTKTSICEHIIYLKQQEQREREAQDALNHKECSKRADRALGIEYDDDNDE